jgi:hypothetical protein
VRQGLIERATAHPAEIRDNDEPDLARIALFFDKRSFGELRLMIDEINRFGFR